MISYEKALDILQQQAEPLATQMFPIGETLNHICAENLSSQQTIPPFDNSAMDGFAVVAVQTESASTDAPLSLTVKGSTVAGDTPSDGTEGAWEIMTGAALPQGYDTVVKVEDVTITQTNAEGRPEAITLTAPVPLNNNIRRAGEDFQVGDEITQTGTHITANHIMALATVGIGEISTYTKPRITIFSTGKEVTDDMNIALKPGQIRNSNSPYLMSILSQMNTVPTYAGIIHDEPEIFETRVQEALNESDVIISTGAVSAGRHDFIPDSLRKLGAEIHFHKVAIRPGKPILYAKFPDGTHYFGLPGNPVSAAIGLRFFVTPLLRHLQGLEAENPITARLLMPFPKKQGLRFFRKIHLSVAAGGKLQMEILKGQESFKIKPMLTANGWASFAPEQNGSEVGEAIEVYPLLPNSWVLETVSWDK